MPTCLNCKSTIYFIPAEKPEGPGHVYSDMGRREYQISGLCEFCFDEITKDPDDAEE